MIRAGRAPLVVCLVLAACGGGDFAWQGFVRDTLGHRQVVNPAAPLSGGESGLLELEWSTSGPAGAEELWAEPRQISVDGESIYLTDPQLSRIHRVSLAGEPLPSIGRRGEGPGEFEEPWVALPAEGFLWVLDPPGGTFERVSVTGEPLGAVPTEGVIFEARSWLDSLLIRRWREAEPVWWVVTPSGFDRRLELPGLEPLEADEGSACARVSTGPGMIYRLRCRALEWERISATGQVEVRVSSPITAPEVTDEQLDHLLAVARRAMGELGVPAGQVELELDRIRDRPRVQMAFQELAADPRSGLVVVWAQTPEDFGSGPAVVHLFSDSGVYLAMQKLGESWVDVTVRDGMLYALAVEEDTGLRWLRAYRLQVPAEAEEKLAAVEARMRTGEPRRAHR